MFMLFQMALFQNCKEKWTLSDYVSLVGHQHKMTAICPPVYWLPEDH